MAISLRDVALQVLGDLSHEQRGNYHELVSALMRRFSPTNQSEIFKVQLKSRTRKPKGTLPELAQAVRRLTRQAYPTAPSDFLESLAKECFVEALDDSP